MQQPRYPTHRYGRHGDPTKSKRATFSDIKNTRAAFNGTQKMRERFLTLY